MKNIDFLIAYKNINLNKIDLILFELDSKIELKYH